MDIDDALISWYLKHKRDLPWRNTRDPYLIWISEIILQQTRVNQGLPYYYAFAEAYPNVKSLAAAPEDEVLKRWQGLGYYSRARNLLATARYITREKNGVFPRPYTEILTLKGIGPYTAAAIASFAFGEARAVVDGNVSRVLARVFDVATPVNSSTGQKEINALADACLNPSRPGIYNQAIMELGALVCTPASPNCSECPLEGKCLSRLRGTIAERPVKIKSKKARVRHIDYAVIESDEGIYFKKRTEKDIWQGLHDFKAVEGLAEPNEKYMTEAVSAEFSNLKLDKPATAPVREYTHLLSHQRIQARFWHYKISGKLDDNSVYFSVPKMEINKLAVPRLIHKYLEDASLV